MAELMCSRCGAKKKGLEEAPYENDLGRKVYEQVCASCWDAWVAQQLMLMNEYRLDPMNDEHSKFLDQQMVTFLVLKQSS